VRHFCHSQSCLVKQALDSADYDAYSTIEAGLHDPVKVMRSLKTASAEVSVDCRQYIDEYLAADADDELTAAERRVVEEHLGRCAACRARLADERVLKSLVRHHRGIVKAPADLRLRIRAALGEMAERDLADRRPEALYRTPAARGAGQRAQRQWSIARVFAGTKRRQSWIPLALAAPLLVLIAVISGRLHPVGLTQQLDSNPEFDLAISKYEGFQQDFHPNMPVEEYNAESGFDYAWVMSRDSVYRVSDEIADVARSYREVQMPGDVYDFESAGYDLYGGRFDHLADGRPVTYTLYRGSGGMVLSICFKDARMFAPLSGSYWVGVHSFLRYKGYTLCITFYPTDHFVSILVARVPITELIRAVALSHMSGAGE